MTITPTPAPPSTQKATPGKTMTKEQIETIKETQRNQILDIMMAILSSASSAQIDPKKYWAYIQKAMLTSAQRSAGPEEWLTEMCKSLGLETLHKGDGSSIYLTCEAIKQQRTWHQVKALVIAEEFYLIAALQKRREEAKRPYDLGDKTFNEL